MTLHQDRRSSAQVSRISDGLLIGVLCVAAVSAGCLGAQQQSTLDNMAAAVSGEKTNTVPVVEAFLEFAAPNAKWAGPASLSLHLSAREGEFAKLVWTSRTLQKSLDGLPGASPQAAPGNRVTLTSARQALAQLEVAMKEPADTFFGCTAPISVKLIKSTGGVVEKQGCRSDRGWPKLASQLTSQWLNTHAQKVVPGSPLTKGGNGAPAGGAVAAGAPNDPQAKSPGAAFASGAHPAPVQGAAAGRAPSATAPGPSAKESSHAKRH